MALYYWRKNATTANFGDYVGPYLFWKITGNRPRQRQPHRAHWVTVGSLLSPQHINAESRVWGSGILKARARFPRPSSIAAVRGPYSRQRCLAQGYSCPEVYGDPALLLPRVYRPRPQRMRYDVGIVLHHQEKPPPKVPAGVCYITLLHRDGDNRAFESIIDRMCSCRCVASSSLHGIIVAHAYGIPAAWCQFGKRVGPDNIKFLDYYHGLGLKQVSTPLVAENAIRWTAVQWCRAIQAFPQPVFPVNTEALWKSCPFRGK